MAAVLESLAAGVEIVLCLVLVALAWGAWRRVGSRRMALLAIAFLLLLLQGAVVATGLFTTRIGLDTAVAWGLVLESAALLLIYVGVLRP